MEHQSHVIKEKSAKKRKLSCSASVTKEEEEQNANHKLSATPYLTLNPLLSKEQISDLKWEKIKRKNLDLDYVQLFPKIVANSVLQTLEEQVEYFTGDLARVRVFGKWHDLPRKQVW